MNRRTFITAAGASLAAGTAFHSSSTHGAEAAAATFPFSLPDLPYAPEALEPHIDAMTMNIHHGKHHAAYIANLVKALESAKVEATDALVLLKGLSGLPTEIQTAVRNNGGGHVNHSLFWKWLAPEGKGGEPSKALAAALSDTFGSLEDFQKAFADAGAKRFGSGWAWLIVNSDGKLAVTSTPNQDNPWMKEFVPEDQQGVPILGVDVWEHAYYLKYQNKRAEYLTAFWKVVNWTTVNQAYAAIVG